MATFGEFYRSKYGKETEVAAKEKVAAVPEEKKPAAKKPAASKAKAKQK